MKKYLITCQTVLCYGHKDIWNFILEVNLSELSDTARFVLEFEKYNFVKNYIRNNADKFNYQNWTNAGNYHDSNSAYIARTEILSMTEFDNVTLYQI